MNQRILNHLPMPAVTRESLVAEIKRGFSVRKELVQQRDLMSKDMPFTNPDEYPQVKSEFESLLLKINQVSNEIDLLRDQLKNIQPKPNKVEMESITITVSESRQCKAGDVFTDWESFNIMLVAAAGEYYSQKAKAHIPPKIRIILKWADGLEAPSWLEPSKERGQKDGVAVWVYEDTNLGQHIYDYVTFMAQDTGKPEGYMKYLNTYNIIKYSTPCTIN